MTTEIYDPTKPKESVTFTLKPLMFETFVCTMAMMAFVTLIGPIGKTVGLLPWQVGMAVTVAGIAWMFCGRVWGRASDRYGRRPVILMGLLGFALSYAALCLFIEFAIQESYSIPVVFAGFLLLRGAAGAFYAAVPATANAFIADNVKTDKRAGSIAMLGAASGAGMVLGPAIAGNLAVYDIVLPLYIIATLPFIALAVLWRVLPNKTPSATTGLSSLALFDPRIRLPMAIAFISMFSVTIAQITVGFFAIDHFSLSPEEGAKVAGIALTCVGVALIFAQVLVKALGWSPITFIRVGGLVSAIGFAAVGWATTPIYLWVCYFIAAAGMGWVWPSISALAANSVDDHEQGATAGTISAAQGLGTILGPLVGTIVYEFDYALPYITITILLTFLVLWSLRKAA